MSSSSSNSTPSPGWFPAWFMSFAFHTAGIVLLVSAIESAPRRGTDLMDGTIEVILNHTPASNETYAVPTAVTEAVVEAAAPTEPVSEPIAEAPTPPTTHAATTDSPPPAEPLAQNIEGGNYGPTGEGQARVRVFGVEGVGRKFIYVFDRSTSMEGPPIAAAKQQLMQSLNALESLHQFHIIFFNQQPRHFTIADSGRRIPFATNRNKQLAAKFVGGITPDGGTERMPALQAALAMQPDVIFFLTDADDPMPASELAEIERLNQRAGSTISTIEFGLGPRTSAANFLTQLAQMTGGQYGYVDTQQLTRAQP